MKLCESRLKIRRVDVEIRNGSKNGNERHAKADCRMSMQLNATVACLHKQFAQFQEKQICWFAFENAGFSMDT